MKYRITTFYYRPEYCEVEAGSSQEAMDKASELSFEHWTKGEEEYVDSDIELIEE